MAPSRDHLALMFQNHLKIKVTNIKNPKPCRQSFTGKLSDLRNNKRFVCEEHEVKNIDIIGNIRDNCQELFAKFSGDINDLD